MRQELEQGLNLDWLRELAKSCDNFQKSTNDNVQKGKQVEVYAKFRLFLLPRVEMWKKTCY